MIPEWLRRRRGDVTRAAQLRLCRRCHQPVLAGLDADMCALMAWADPTPIDEIGEAKALLAGRTTYDLINTNGRKELHYRDQWNIPAPRRYLVFPEHRCGESLAAHMAAVPTKP